MSTTQPQDESAKITPDTNENSTSLTSEKTVSQGLWSISFISLVITQGLTAFNDNMFRFFVAKYGQYVLKEHGYGDSFAIALGGFLLTLPFLLVTPVAAFLGDRYPKKSVIVACKFLEIILMLIGVMVIPSGNIWVLMLVLFFMGTQSALFSPAKMGAIPEIVPGHALPNANGIFGMTTIISIAAGMIAGYNLYDISYPLIEGKRALAGVSYAAWAFLSVAGIGFIISLFINTLPAADLQRKFNANPVKEFGEALFVLFKRFDLTMSAVGVACFYLIGFVCQTIIDSYCQNYLKITEPDKISYITGTLILGIAFGSIIAGVISQGKVVLKYSALGMLGISIFTFSIFLVSFMDVSPLKVYLFSGLLIALGTAASLYYIPLEVYLQHYSDVKERGSVFAASNAITNFLMIMGSLFLMVMQQISAPTNFMLLSIFCIPLLLIVTMLTLKDWGRFVFRMILRCYFNTFYKIKLHGWDKLPKEGGCVIVPNHISWVDGAMLMAVSPRMIRFMIYENFTKKWYIQWASDLMDVIPTSAAQGPKAMIKTIQTAQQAVKDGGVLGIFPEGVLSRHGNLNPFQKGIVKILEKADGPVFPVAIEGLWGSIFSYRERLLFRWPKKFRSRVHITLGDPVPKVESPSTMLRIVQDLCAKSIIKYKHNEYDIPARRFVRSCRKSLFRSKVADSAGLDLTGGKLLTGVLAMSKALSKHIPAGDKFVGILLPPSVGGVLANASLAMMKRVTVNLNYTLSDDVMNFCIKNSGINYVVTSKKFLEKKPVNLNAKLIFLEDVKEEITPLIRNTSAAIAFGLPAFLIERLYGLTKVSLDDLMTVVYTSGSTGEPKGVMLSQRNLASNIEAVDRLFCLTKNDSLIGILPFFHSFGYTISLWTVLNLPAKGAYHFNPLDARQVGKLAESHKGTILLSTPTFLRSYLKRCPPEQFKYMRLIVAGAEKLPQELVQECLEKIKVKPIEGYGATELSPLACANVPDQIGDNYQQIGNKLGTVGQPISGVRVKVLNPDTNQEILYGQEGILYVQGENVMQGYLNAPEKTAEVLKDGWYNTGDMVKIDEDGFVVITGRKSRFSKIGGEMVPHIKVEEELLNILKKLTPESTADQQSESQAAEVMLAVTAVPDDKKGERLIVLHKKLPFAIEELYKAYSSSGVPNLWIPDRESFIEVEEIPLLGTGKLDLKMVKDKALELTKK